MDQDLARILATGGNIASRELTRLYELPSRHLPENEALRSSVASALAEIGLNVIQPAFDAHPELQVEFERRVAKYGSAT